MRVLRKIFSRSIFTSFRTGLWVCVPRPTESNVSQIATRNGLRAGSRLSSFSSSAWTFIKTLVISKRLKLTFVQHLWWLDRRLDWGLALLLFLALTDLRHRRGMLLYARHCVYPLEFWRGNYVLNNCWTELKSILIDTTSNCAWYKKRCIQVTTNKVFFSELKLILFIYHWNFEPGT